MGYEHFDHSGDVGVRAWGDSLDMALSDLALGMYALVAAPGSVEDHEEEHVLVERDTLEDTIVAWLNELIYLMDAHGFMGCVVDVNEATENRIESSISGEEFDPDRHEGGLEIKAATYHGLRVERVDDRLEIEVIFDL